MNSTQLKRFLQLQVIVGVFVLLLLSFTIIISTVVANPGTITSTTQDSVDEFRAQSNWGLGLGAGIAIGLAGLGAGLGLGSASSAAIGAISERPEVFGRTIIFIAFIEGIGVFGFVIAFLLYLSIGG
jgi:V/A-type H+-transporting ATPase subunit K